MKKLLVLVLSLVMLASVALAAEADVQELALGTSGLSVTIPASYAAGEITAEDTDESQVGYYKSEETTLDFDVYQWAKAEGETLESIAAAEAAEYGAEALAGEINGLTVYTYLAEEESEGTTYATATCLMENGDFIAEIVFWLDGENAVTEADAIMNTLTVTGEASIDEGGTEIVLGTSNLKITAPFNYVQGEISAEDTDENQVAYYTSEDTLIDFDVYQWAKTEGETAESVATEEAAEYGSEIFEAQSDNGVTFDGYYANEEFEGKTYETLTVIAESGNDFVEIVFWIDGEDIAQAELDVTAILATLAQF